MTDPIPSGVGRDSFFDASVTVVAIAVAALAVVLGSGVLSDEATRNVGNLTQVIAPLLAAWACARAALRSRGRGWRAGWLLVGASCASWAVGQTIWTWFETIQGEVTPFPSFADAFYLLAVPLAVAGMLWFPSSQGTQAGRARTLLDGLIVATSVLWISWITVLGPTLQDGSGTPFERAIGLAYPAGDAVLLTIVIIACVRCDPAGRVATAFVAVGFAAFALADSVFAYTALHEDAVSEVSNVAWVAGYLLIALGALHATRHPPERTGRLAGERQSSGRLALLLPYAPVAVVLVIAAGGAMVNDPIVVDDTVFWIGAILIALLLVRQGVVLLENTRLARSLEISNHQLRYRVLHDGLTGLPNRPLFLDRLRVVLSRLQRVPETVAVMFLDLDHFKPVNDTLGHESGDEVLAVIGMRVASVVRDGDTVARFGGDEFLVLCEDVGSAESALELGERILAVVALPIDASGETVAIGCSIGIVLVDRPGLDAEELIRRADRAMYDAKRAGRGRIELRDQRAAPLLS